MVITRGKALISIANHGCDYFCVFFRPEGHFLLGDHRYRYPLTVVNHVSRYLLAYDAFPSNEGPQTRRACERIFGEYGPSHDPV